jgi:hypothetical protein
VAVTAPQWENGLVDEPDEDEGRNVQLVVIGLVVGAVFVVLPLGYLLRKRLGRTAYTPPPDAH